MAHALSRGTPAGALLAVLLMALAPSPARAEWDTQISSRLALGGGAYLLENGQDPWPLFELGLRADVLFGERLAEQVRFGPALDLRTEDFRTFEAAGGLSLLLPTGREFAIVVSAGAGYGFRPDGRDGALVFGTLAWGYRPFNYFSVYGYALNLYVSSRVQVEPEPRAYEITAGVEVDFEFMFAIPFMFIVQATRGGDPDEPVQP